MTVVATVKTNNSVLMAADSFMGDGNRLMRDTEPKIWRNGDFLFGAAGDVRVMQAIRYAYAAPDHPEAMNIDAYMIWTFPQALRTFLDDHGFLVEEDTKRRRAELELLVVYQGRIWEIDGDVSAVEVPEVFNAIGSGSEVCRAALHALKGREAPRDVLLKAMEITAYHVRSVCGPFVIEEVKIPAPSVS